MKRLLILIAVLMLIPVAVAEEYQIIGNPAMILFNVTPESFDDCRVYVLPLDQYGRASGAFAILSPASVDSERRQDISAFAPAGWQSGGIYHRCHLVGAQLTSGTACPENLVTGTEYLNLEGMLPVENRARTYILRSGEHVLYKVTPIYQGTELLPRAVEITLYSIESSGLRMTAYCYNVQPGYVIDYATGRYRSEDEPEELVLTADGLDDPANRSGQPDYILNVKSKRFHYPWCPGASDISEKNRQDYHGTREELVNQGYKPCGSCNP